MEQKNQKKYEIPLHIETTPERLMEILLKGKATPIIRRDSIENMRTKAI